MTLILLNETLCFRYEYPKRHYPTSKIEDQNRKTIRPLMKNINNTEDKAIRVLFSVTSKGDERKVISDTDIISDILLCTFTGPIIDYEVTKDLGKKESYALQV